MDWVERRTGDDAHPDPQTTTTADRRHKPLDREAPESAQIEPATP
jgi:hypothetical protein